MRKEILRNFKVSLDLREDAPPWRQDAEKESAIEAHSNESEERDDVKDQTQTSERDPMTSTVNCDKLAATEKISRTQEDPMCQQGSYFKDYEDYEETDEDIEEVQTPQREGQNTGGLDLSNGEMISEMKRSKESKKMGADICDFETPSEKAGLVFHCPVEHQEDEQRDNSTPLHCPTDDQEDGSPEKEIVKLYIGLERVVIRVYKKILCEKIPYFENFFNGTSQESASNSVTFPSGDFEAFHDLMWWASNGHLPPWSIYPDGKEMDERMQDDCPVVRIETGFNWGGLCLLANKLCVTNLMNLITDYVVRALELNRAILTKEDIAGIYKHTLKNCGLRRLACYSFNYDLDRCLPELWPRYCDMAKRIDGLEDESVALRRGSHGEMVTFTGIWDFPPCNFHDHLNGEICDQKKLKDREVGIRRPGKIH
ncbi:hypothetical protein BCON_0075g00310 [Botryotinia convoluta]|uniref:BTB domain-containing protein n=1 Tax=Botryotinia convoluta TaxID=54673 RepID=A0A4Z1I4U0_9HELO|nr:hypothetical protein BCON_0075g00310 [Botryotinia convoluta]